jgi:GT2 family glycosyltransferase
MKLNIGFLTYNSSSLKYLPFFLESLKEAVSFLNNKRNDIDIKITALDNSVDFTGNYEYLNTYNLANFEVIKSEGNIGFAKGFNLMINRAVKESADFFLVINPDIVLDSESLYEMLSFLSKKEDASSVSPVILKWDFERNAKTKIVDSLGIGINSYHKFFDIGQGDSLDTFNNLPYEIFGPSGACALFKIEALKDVSYNLEFFDELMFMYKEDIDLSYRLQLSSFKSYLVDKAFVYHDRSLSSKNSLIKHILGIKRDKSRSRSFINQLILTYKFKDIDFPIDIKIKSSIRRSVMFFYGFFFELKSLYFFFLIRKKVREKKKKVKISDLGKFNILSLIKK